MSKAIFWNAEFRKITPHDVRFIFLIKESQRNFVITKYRYRSLSHIYELCIFSPQMLPVSSKSVVKFPSVRFVNNQVI